MRTAIPLSTRPAGLLPADLRVELDSFLLSMEAENLAPKTRRTYGEAVELFGRFVASRGMPSDPMHPAHLGCGRARLFTGWRGGRRP